MKSSIEAISTNLALLEEAIRGWRTGNELISVEVSGHWQHCKQLCGGMEKAERRSTAQERQC